MPNPRPSGLSPKALVRASLAATLLLASLLGPSTTTALTLPSEDQLKKCDRASCGPVRQGTSVICFTPAHPAPSELWDQLQPAETGPLPSVRDTTNFNEFVENYASRNWFNGVDIENGWVLAGLAHGIGIWDARTNPAAPNFITAKRYGASAGFPFIPPGEASKIVFGAIDAPEGNDNVAAVVGYNDAGILVFDLRDKNMPRPVYQSTGKTSESVYAVKIANTNYAYMASSSGLFIYNLDKALTYNGCREETTVPNAGECPGVLVRHLVTAGTPYFVHGVDNYLIVGYGSSRGFELFDISDPVNPLSKGQTLRGTSGRPVQGVAMWRQGSTYYAGARLGITKTDNQPQTAIYNVSCITGSCTGLSPIWSGNYNSKGTSDYLTFSRSGSTPFLYLGSDAGCGDGSQREWLLDVSNPGAPVDITPSRTVDVPAYYSGVKVTKPVNYWTWYYRDSTSGYNLMAPRTGKFLGEYFFRAGRSLLDIHKRVGSIPPGADFSWSPTEIYPGTPVTFTDRSSGAPTAWSWGFPDGAPAFATSQNPQVTFSSAGAKTVSLSAQNASGQGSTNKSVVVLDPTPAGTVSGPASVTACQQANFTVAATGAPTLTYTWEVLDGSNMVVAGPVNGGTSYSWTSPPGVQPGTYTGRVTVKNSFSPNGVPLTKSFVVAALPTLTNISSLAPAAQFTTNVVKFTAPAHVGASKWTWDFGDGVVQEYTDPLTGPTPQHTYAAKGTYNAKVTISNCTNASSTSQTVQVIVVETTPLVAAFQAGLFCNFGQCFATTGTPVTFTDQSTGAEAWDYDWNHTGSDPATCNFTDANHASAVTAHTYTSSGVFQPCLRVRRGTEQKVTVHSSINVSNGSGGGGTTSILVSGPSSGQPNQAYTFSASASGCSPSNGGWTWNASGGSIAGASNGSSISVTWTTTGPKTVTASNSGCGTTTGSRNITIADSNGNPGGPFAAAYTYTPAAPKAGEAVSFNGSSSSGVPAGASFSWDFGDGTAAGIGTVVSHTFANAGNYVVRLSILPSGCLNTSCVKETSKVVVVAPGNTVQPVSADFTSSVTCSNLLGFEQCPAETGKTVTFTASATDATSYSWKFGDGSTATGRQVTHTWSQPDTYFVELTVNNGLPTVSTRSRMYVVSGAPVASAKAVVLPWIAQTRGALDQSSDLYVHNPSTASIDVTLEFRKRGQPESNPPRVTRAIPAGATLYVGDVLRELFNRENIAGFVSVVVDKGGVEPVITSFNTTFQTDGKQFGQTVSGVSMSTLGAAAGSQAEKRVQNLVGLINNEERLAYFGISNPGPETSSYRLRFFDKEGRLLGESTQDLFISSFGQRQYQAREIGEFGVSNVEDYRVEIETKSGGTVIPYASNLRIQSEDPSFIEPGIVKTSKVHLLGVLSAPGLNSSIWQSDVLLSNPGAQPVTVDLTFTALGVNSTPTPPFRVTVPAGQTQRLENVVESRWGIRNGIGVLTVASATAGGALPVVQGESYENTNPQKRFGQAMTAFGESDAAGAGKGLYMVGLRQGTNHRTTLWIFNPSTAAGEYDLIYRALDGTLLGKLENVQLAAGKMRQLSPGQHPLPAAGVANGFTLQIVVKSGKVLGAAQVINNATNDPAYIKGEVR